MKPLYPSINETWTDDNGVEMVYVGNNQWIKKNNNGYVRYKRSSEYPSVEEQLDMLFHELSSKGSIDDTGEWYNTILTIKDNNPKIPEE
jgi:hypothetical protein